MTSTLTKSEMLSLWKRIRAVEPLRLDCTALRTDGPDVDAILTDEMRAWYLDMLDHGPESALVPCDVTKTATIETLSEGRTLISAPQGCRRILSVWFSDWDYPVKVTPLPENQGPRNPYCRRPHAFSLGPDRVAVTGARGTLKELKCALDISDQVYIFDDSAIKKIQNT